MEVRIAISFLFSCTALLAFSQKHDYIWYYGWSNGSPSPDFAGGKIDFHTNPPTALPERRPVDLDFYGHIMADSSGQRILYYSSGKHIYNSDNSLMENGDSINPGFWFNLSSIKEYASALSGLSIPFPSRDREYLYFHQRIDTLRTPPVCCNFYKDIFYTHIDMKANGGLGKVISKNNVVSSDFNSCFGLTKMDDNSGWWLAFATFRSKVYHVYSVDSTGVHRHKTDTLGVNIYQNNSWNDITTQGGFSPNGNTFARFDQFHGITALDFSRCTGRLSNARFYPVDSTLSSTSLAFSPNSRFIYYNNSRQLMQLDTRANPGEYAVDTIAQWDGYYDSAPPFTSGFGFSQLAPDGKIYMTVTATGRFMHVIERPDLPGQACGFRQHGFPLPHV